MAFDWLKHHRVLLTGHTGFKGTWAGTLFDQIGVEFAGLSRSGEEFPLYGAVKWSGQHREYWGDVSDSTFVQGVLQDFRPTLILHMAAESLVIRAAQQPRRTWTTNVMGTACLLEAAGTLESVAVLVVTSDKCYGNDGSHRARNESDPLGGTDPYSASKAATELLVQSWPPSASMRVCTVRGGNVIGGGDMAPHRLVPDFYRALNEKRPLHLRTPSGVRPWQDVRDCLGAYLAVGERLAAGTWPFESVNVASDQDECTVESVVSRLVEMHPGVSVTEGRGNPLEHHWLRLDTSRMRSELDLPASLPMEKLLSDADGIYMSLHAGQDVTALLRRQWTEWLR